MLKLAYTEQGTIVTRLTKPLEKIVAQRAILAARLGQSLYMEKAVATLLFAADLPGIQRLQPELDIAPVDNEGRILEARFHGLWIGSEPESEQGMLLCVLQPVNESLVVALWQASRACASV